MTLRTSERNPTDILYEIARAYPGGVEALAQRMDTSGKKLYKKLSPATPDVNVTLDEFSLIVEMCDGANVKHAIDPVQALCFRHGGFFVSFDELAETSNECIRESGMKVMQHMGEVTGEINDALHDDHLTDNEVDRIESRFRRMLAASKAWLERVRSRAKKDKERRQLKQEA